MQAIIFAREEKGNKERVQLRKKEMVGADGQWKRRHILWKGENADECIL